MNNQGYITLITQIETILATIQTGNVRTATITSLNPILQKVRQTVPRLDTQNQMHNPYIAQLNRYYQILTVVIQENLFYLLKQTGSLVRSIESIKNFAKGFYDYGPTIENLRRNAKPQGAAPRQLPPCEYYGCNIQPYRIEYMPHDKRVGADRIQRIIIEAIDFAQPRAYRLTISVFQRTSVSPSVNKEEIIELITNTTCETNTDADDHIVTPGYGNVPAPGTPPEKAGVSIANLTHFLLTPGWYEASEYDPNNLFTANHKQFNGAVGY